MTGPVRTKAPSFSPSQPSPHCPFASPSRSREAPRSCPVPARLSPIRSPATHAPARAAAEGGNGGGKTAAIPCLPPKRLVKNPASVDLPQLGPGLSATAPRASRSGSQARRAAVGHAHRQRRHGGAASRGFGAGTVPAGSAPVAGHQSSGPQPQLKEVHGGPWRSARIRPPPWTEGTSSRSSYKNPICSWPSWIARKAIIKKLSTCMPRGAQ